jgi:hypothetical protein
MTDALAVGLDIALVPGKAKRCLRYLDDEEIKVSVGRQPRYYNVHDFDWTDGFYFYTARAGVDAEAATARAASAAIFILVNRFRILLLAFIL